MSNETTTTRGPRAGLRARLGGLNVVRKRGALGVPEIAALGVAALLLLTAVLSYLFLLAPQRSRKDALEAERGDLQRKLKDQQSILGQGQDTQQRVGEILTSLSDFEVDKLGQASSGSQTVIGEMNRLIIKNHLRISGGVSFTQLQETVPGADPNRPQQRREESAQRIVQSVFPGIGVTLTVEGTYANLRHFIRDIEADRQFVVIDAVELEGVTDTNASASMPVVAPQESLVTQGQPVAPQATAPATPSRGALVSLRLEMAAYFRRANAGVAPQ